MLNMGFLLPQDRDGWMDACIGDYRKMIWDNGGKEMEGKKERENTENFNWRWKATRRLLRRKDNLDLKDM